MTNKILASYDTADRRNCVNTGYTYALYADGRISATSFSRWQGSRSDARYVSRAGQIDVASLSAEQDGDAEAALIAATRDIDPTVWRQTRRGYIVR